jgi:hypothetical protein
MNLLLRPSCPRVAHLLRGYLRVAAALPWLALAPLAHAGPGLLNFLPGPSVNEDAGTTSFTVTRTNGSDGSIAVNYHSADGSATSDEDFVALSGTLHWADGEATPRTIVMTLIDDNRLEPTEYAPMLLTDPQGDATIGDVPVTYAAILDNEIPVNGRLNFEPGPNASESSGTMTFTVTRSGGSEGAIRVAYESAVGSALPGEDFVAVAGELQWGDGDAQPKSFTLTLIDDVFTEPTEYAPVLLSNPQGGAVIGDVPVTYAGILDNDTPTGGRLNFLTGLDMPEGEAGGVTLTVLRSEGSTGSVSVDYFSDTGTATPGLDFVPISGTLHWADGDLSPKTFMLMPIDDSVVEPTEYAPVLLGNPQGGAVIGDLPNVYIAIIDDDTDAIFADAFETAP